MSFSVTRVIHFCYGHRLLGYAGKCRFPHGHNGRLEVTIARPKLDKMGFVMDFEDIKAAVQRWVDAELDHKFLLNKKDPLVRVFTELGEPFVALDGNPTAEAIAKLVFDHARRQKLPVSEVRLWETVNSFATYKG